MRTLLRVSVSTILLLILGTPIALGAPIAPRTRAEATSDEATSDEAGARACEYGITLALSGEDAGAESVFVSVLSRSPGDARALNNLGNLNLWRGDPEVALAFYARAAEADSGDAGIVLNQATAFLIAGRDEDATVRAAEGVRRAGGPAEAARLLGLRYEGEEDASRASDRVQVSRDEVLSLLRAAAHAVPADSARAARVDATSDAGKARKRPAWRSAGARGAAGSDAAAVVYWKR